MYERHTPTFSIQPACAAIVYYHPPLLRMYNVTVIIYITDGRKETGCMLNLSPPVVGFSQVLM